MNSILTDFDEWKDVIVKQYERNPNWYPTSKPDISFAERIKSYISGYMTGPVALVNDEAIEARTRRVKNFSDAIEYFSNNDHKFYLYEVNWHGSVPQWVDESTFNPSVEPKIIDGYWQIRYAEKENS